MSFKFCIVYSLATSEPDPSNSQLHAISSGLKAVATNDTVKGVDICRLACGGHGYLSSSNLPRIYSTVAASITYEGENTVLFLQVAR